MTPELESFVKKHRATFAQGVRLIPGRQSWSTARIERSGEIERLQQRFIRDYLEHNDGVKHES